jgi:hypothetical protein
MIRKSGNRFSETIMLKQFDKKPSQSKKPSGTAYA